MPLTLLVDGRPYPPEAITPDLLREDHSYHIVLTTDVPVTAPEQYRAVVGGLTLPPPQRGHLLTELHWEWSPDFFTGQFSLELFHAGQRLYPAEGEATHLVVSPNDRKLTADRYQAMLDDLTRWTTGWLMPGPGLRSADVDSNPADSLLAQLDYLTRHWPRIAHLVESVLARPRRRLERTVTSTPLHAVRTIDADEWPQVLQNLSTWEQFDGPVPAGLRQLHRESGDLLPVRLPQARSRSTLDVPENAFVSRFLHEVQATLERATEMLVRLRAATLDTEKPLVDQRRSDAQGLLRQTRRWLHATWLAEVAPTEGPVNPTVALKKDPIYGAIWRYYQQWRRAVLLKDGGDQAFSLARTHELYELWCFLTVLRVAAELTGLDPDAAMTGALSGAGSMVRLDLRPRQAAHFDLPGRSIRISYQRHFPGHPSAAGVYSFSHMMIPDISIEWAGADGVSRLLLLDPKYRVSEKPVTEGLDDMHRYRDALVGPTGVRAVDAGYLLCPNQPTELRHQRYLDSAYQSQWRFGICVLAPGAGAGGLRTLLSRYLMHVGTPPLPVMKEEAPEET